MSLWNRKLGKLTLLVLAGALLVTMGTAASCSDKSQRLREESVEQRLTTLERALKVAPNPVTVNFPLRRALVEFTERQDMLNHPTYVYVLADTGQILGYYVAKTFPVNICAFLSSTEDARGNGAVLTAPSLDGIYYGGAGSSSPCNGWFFFDYSTNALIELIDMKIFVADQPLRVEAEPFTVETVNTPNQP